MRGAALLLALCAIAPGLAHAQDNLLANPGFEDLAGSMPARWDVYVQPLEGATGKLSDVAHTGKLSVQLQVSTPYERDPANNWSQNVIGEYGGKKMRLSGFVKVQDAQDAAIWAQCWRKKPLGVVTVASTSNRAPVYGTRDWDETFVEFDVPQNTDFITVRCVLKGTGTAWFDDVTLIETGEAARKPDPPVDSEAAAKDKPKEKRPPTKSALGQEVRDELELVRLREENRLLKEAVESLKSSNKDLSERVKLLEDKRDAK
jgi:hypothetical protein